MVELLGAVVSLAAVTVLVLGALVVIAIVTLLWLGAMAVGTGRDSYGRETPVPVGTGTDGRARTSRAVAAGKAAGTGDGPANSGPANGGSGNIGPVNGGPVNEGSANDGSGNIGPVNGGSGNNGPANRPAGGHVAGRRADLPGFAARPDTSPGGDAREPVRAGVASARRA